MSAPKTCVYFDATGQKQFVDISRFSVTGNWSSTTTYSADLLQIAFYGNINYVCITSGSGNVPPVSPVYWSPLVKLYLDVTTPPASNVVMLNSEDGLFYRLSLKNVDTSISARFILASPTLVIRNDTDGLFYIVTLQTTEGVTNARIDLANQDSIDTAPDPVITTADDTGASYGIGIKNVDGVPSLYFYPV